MIDYCQDCHLKQQQQINMIVYMYVKRRECWNATLNTTMRVHERGQNFRILHLFIYCQLFVFFTHNYFILEIPCWQFCWHNFRTWKALLSIPKLYNNCNAYSLVNSWESSVKSSLATINFLFSNIFILQHYNVEHRAPKCFSHDGYEQTISIFPLAFDAHNQT